MKILKKLFKDRSSRGFTRLEALISVGAVTLLFVTFGSAFGHMTTRQDEVVCKNNLRIITEGYTAFANENGERYPWQLPIQEWNSPWTRNLFFKFFALSNYVQSPRVLADPADYRQPNQPQLRIATSWGDGQGGLIHPTRRNNAISYFVSQYGTPLHSQSFLSGDRNLRVENVMDGDRFGDRQPVFPATTGWTDQVHRGVGHIAFTDGAVERTDTMRMREIAAWWTPARAYVQLPFFQYEP